MNYQKPVVQKFGTFRELTRWGMASASDGGSFFGIATSPGCETEWGGQTYEIGCPTAS